MIPQELSRTPFGELNNEPLWCLATSVEAAIRDVGDLLAVNNDERVWCGDGGIHGVRAASNKWRDHALYNLAREEGRTASWIRTMSPSAALSASSAARVDSLRLLPPGTTETLIP